MERVKGQLGGGVWEGKIGGKYLQRYSLIIYLQPSIIKTEKQYQTYLCVKITALNWPQLFKTANDSKFDYNKRSRAESMSKLTSHFVWEQINNRDARQDWPTVE